MTSYRLSVDPISRKASRFLGRVRREIQKAFEEERATRNLTQAEIARVLGVDRSSINRQLMGTENLTLRRVGELSAILGRDIDFTLVKPTIPAGANIPYEKAAPVPTFGECPTSSETSLLLPQKLNEVATR